MAASEQSWLHHMRRVYGIPLVALVGLGFWVQGFRVFPWLAVNYYLKDGLKLDPGMLQFLQQTTNFPFLAKPVYGLVSDAVYINGAHRVPYLILAALVQVLAWGTIAFHPTASTSVGIIALYLTLSNFGVAIGEVANDAIIAEFGKRKGSTAGELQSFAWLAASSGALLGNLLAGVALNRLQTTTIFGLFFAVVAFYLAASVSVSEKALGSATDEISAKTGNDRKITGAADELVKQQSSVRKQLGVVSDLLRRPDIVRPILWFTISVTIIPSLLGSMFYYQTQVLNVDSFYLGLSKMVGQAALLIASLVYNKQLTQIPLHKIAAWIQIVLAASILSDILLVKHINLKLGIPDELYVVLFSGLMEAIAQFKVLPFMVLLGKLCPTGAEGTLMAIFSACLCLANLISGYFGVALASMLGISSEKFNSLGTGIVIEAALALSPVFFTSMLIEKEKTS